MPGSAWPDVIKALITKMRAYSGYQSPLATGSGIPVYDTVEVGLTNDVVTKLLVVGWIGDPDDLPTDAGGSNQSVATLGTLRHRDEIGEVRVAAIVEYGDHLLGSGATDPGTVGAARDEAFQMLNDVDSAIRADPSLGLVGAGYQHVVAYIERVDRIVHWLNEGHKIRVEFVVHYEARI